jgi:hypothetical protein
MSTRACYTFRSDQESFHVYKHSDGYPSGAAEWIEAALQYAWPLPRFEADEFAAAFVAANKSYWRNKEIAYLRKGKLTADEKRGLKDCRDYIARGYDGGGVRLLQTGRIQDVSPGDIQYRYEVSCLDDELYVKAYGTDYWDEPTETEIFSGTLAAFKVFAAIDRETANPYHAAM